MNERYIALREAAMAHDSDAYFEARPQLESSHNRKIFEAGFERGYKARSVTPKASDNPPKQRPVTDHVPQTTVLQTPPNCLAKLGYVGKCGPCGENAIKYPYGHQRGS